MSTSMAKHSLSTIFISVILLGALSSLNGQDLLTAALNTPAQAGVLAESCGGPYELVIQRGAGNQDTTFIFISDSGDAQIGVDYNFTSVNFPIEMLPSDTVVVIPIEVTADGLPEGLESLSWEIAYLAGIESGVINLQTGIVDEYEVEILSPTDTIQWCRFAPLQLTASSTAEIHWSPTFSFDTAVGSEVTVRPFLSGWYFATVGTDSCGATDSVYLDLAIVEILGTDTLYMCLDAVGATLQGRLEGLATSFKWIPSDSTLSNPALLTPVATPVVTTTYILQSDIGVCIAADTVVVRVDSLPQDLHIDIAPLKAYYCAGEIVALFSPSYDSLDFPDIQFNWIPDNGTFLTSRSLFNAALQLQDTTLYFRETTNNACLAKDSILINVVPSSIPLSVTDTTLCPGEMFTVVVLSNQVTDPEWTPADGLSCTKCLDPTVTVIGTPGSSLFYQFSGMILDCPVGSALSITIPPVQPIGITGDTKVCAGDMVTLTINNPEGLTNLQWTVHDGNGTLSCTNCASPVVTINDDSDVSILLNASTTNENFCGAQGFIQLLHGEEVQVTGPDLFACLGGEAVATTGDPSYTNPQWEVVSGDLLLSCSDCDNPTVIVNSLSGRLRFMADPISDDTCKVTGLVNVSVFDPNVSEITVMPDPSAGPIGQGTLMTVLLGVTPPPTGPVTWTVNGVQVGGTGTMIQFNANEDLNFIQAFFINSHGCEQIDTLSFPTVPPSYMIPNAFTPDNGDEINDNFRIIINGNIVIEKFLIFNRWGQKVYEADDDPLSGWDGMFKNQPAASDTYVYTATLRYPDGRQEIAKGDVMLLK